MLPLTTQQVQEDQLNKNYYTNSYNIFKATYGKKKSFAQSHRISEVGRLAGDHLVQCP